jgi:hypothetical protein
VVATIATFLIGVTEPSVRQGLEIDRKRGKRQSNVGPMSIAAGIGGRWHTKCGKRFCIGNNIWNCPGNRANQRRNFA